MKMKTVLKIAIAALLVTPLVLMVGCGKRNHSGQMAKAAPGTPTQDFSSLAYNSGSKDPGFLMSDYILLGPIAGDKDHKRTYAQMNLFFVKADANTPVPSPAPRSETLFPSVQPTDIDAAKKHQYFFFYREFVTCADGPKPNFNLDNSHISIAKAQTGDAILVKGGGLNASGLGVATKLTGKVRGASLVLNQKQNGTASPTNVTLNFKTATSETLEDDMGFPKDATLAKAIDAVKCTEPVAANPAKTIPYGPVTVDLPQQQPPRNGKGNNNADSAKLIPTTTEAPNS
jgi:hypothetical protein